MVRKLFAALLVGTVAFSSEAFSAETPFQFVSNIKITTAAVEVFTPENGGKWGATGCADYNFVYFQTAQGTANYWLTLLLSAKASGRKVKFNVTSCTPQGSIWKGLVDTVEIE